MKKLNHILGNKKKKSKENKYNVFDGNGGSVRNLPPISNKTTVAVHTYSAKVNPLKLKAPRSQQIPKRSTTSHNTGDDNINYASLNRMRNSSNDKTARDQKRRRIKKRWLYKWRRYLCCCITENYCRTAQSQPRKGYWQQSATSCSSTKKRRRCWRHLCCGYWRTNTISATSYSYDTDDDDDIDGKFAAYIQEMKLKEASAATIATTVSGSTSTSFSNMTTSLALHAQSTPNFNLVESVAKTATSTYSNSQISQSPSVFEGDTGAYVTTIAFSFRPRRCSSEAAKPPRAWTWDDSLRSNSDRFLETLEEDEAHAPGVGNIMRRPKLQFLETVTAVGEEAKAAAVEESHSPVIGQRSEATAIPLQSRGSGTSEQWPAQSDEDIDRLVAMHQNRSSLSSLGLRSDSMASVYSGAGEGRYGTVVVKGQVEFDMQYNYKLSALEIHVVRCKDLAAVDAKRNRSDPYVKVYLLPDKSKAGKRKTKVKKHTLNPIFDEVLRFHMPLSSLESRTLWLTVWHSDMFGRNDFLGEVSISLQGKVFDNPKPQWYMLQERSEPFDEIATYRGDIVVGLKYIPPEKMGFMRGSNATGSNSNLRKFGSIKSVSGGSKSDRTTCKGGGQLHVLVKEAKHLSPIKPSGTCDAFCKSYLLPDRTRSSKQKTPVVKRSLHPSWNYTFVYEDVSLDDLSERALELTVWDHDRLASNEFLGGIRFSLGTGKSYGRHADWMDATGKELFLWQNMLDRPNFWVEGSLILRSTLDGIRAIP